MFSLCRAAKLSPEKMARLLGVSGMTLRRWRDMPPDAKLPELYDRAFQSAVQQMIIDGQLPPDSPLAQPVMAKNSMRSFKAIIKSMGFSDTLLKPKREKDAPGEDLILGLSQIGTNESHVRRVEKEKKRISSFAKLSQEWKERVTCLVGVIRSAHLSPLDKLVAYGALFYLVNPLDLIPDNIPVFGYMDDFLILGIAAAYYFKRFPKLFQKSKMK